MNLIRPFDTSTERGRSRERYRRVALTGITSVAAKGCAVLTALVSVPLTVHYLGAERYGMWMTMSSVIALLGFADLGIGNGLLNAVSRAHGRDDAESAGQYMSSAFFMLSGVAVLFASVFAALYPLVPWAGLFNVTSGLAVREAGPAMAVYCACFAIGIPFASIQKMQMAYQEGFTTNFWTGIGSLLGLGGVLLVIQFRGGLPWLVLAMGGAPVAAMLLNWATQLARVRGPMFPRWSRFDWSASRRLASAGFLFFGVQLATVIAFSADNLIAARILGPSAVARYSVAQRLFMLSPAVLGFWLIPLWPAYREAMARGDAAWARRTLFRSTLSSATLAAAAGVVLILFSRWIFTRWIGAQFVPPLALSSGLAVWALLTTIGSAISMYLNGSNAIRVQFVAGSVMAACSVGLKVLLCGTSGLPGLIWGGVIAYAVCTLPVLAVATGKLLRRP